jgi:phosphoribosylanthranilate isomerase
VKHFKQAHAVLPVIHVQDEAQALAMSRLAQSAGANGVFLIGHSMPADELLACTRNVKRYLPGLWVGVNLLGLTPKRSFEVILDYAMKTGVQIEGLWTDRADSTTDALRTECPDLCYFGGTAFKYQPQPKDLEAAARTASLHMDFVTTSGPGTGQAANLSKMQSMKRGVGSGSLALASGITPQNVHEYLPYVDALLVATGISRNFHELDRDKLDQLMVNVRNWKPT